MKTSTNVMIDLETLGTKPGCIVLTLGAVAFDDTGVLSDLGEVHVRLDSDHQHSVGLKADPGTALWWISQPKEAQEQLLDKPEVNVSTVLAFFNEWLEEVTGTNLEDVDYLPVSIWGNGANFDGPILRELYDAFGMRCPWGFWDECCYRTERKSLEALIRQLGGTVESVQREGTYHNALDDAKYQVDVLTSLRSQRDELVIAPKYA